MGILLYQIGIFLAIQLSTFYGGRTSRNVAIILIAIFTILQVFTSQLMIFQFITIFISYLVSRNILGKSNGETIDTIIEEIDDFASGSYNSDINPSKRTKEERREEEFERTQKLFEERLEEDLKKAKARVTKEALDKAHAEMSNVFSVVWEENEQERLVKSKNQDILETDKSDRYKVYQIIKPFIENHNKDVPKKGYHPDRIRYDNMEYQFKLFAQTNRNFKKFIKELNSLKEGMELKDFMNWNKKVNINKHEIYMEFIYKFFRRKEQNTFN